PAVPAVLLAVRDRVHHAGLLRQQAAGRHLSTAVADWYGLLFRLLPDHSAAGGTYGETAADAGFDPCFGTGQGAPLMKQFVAALMMLTLPVAAVASEGAHHPKQMEWSFDGVFGKFDKPSVQRGFQIYKEVCAACHGLNRVAFRTLEGAGFSA